MVEQSPETRRCVLHVVPTPSFRQQMRHRHFSEGCDETRSKDNRGRGREIPSSPLSPIVCNSAILCPCRARSPRFSFVLERSAILDWWRRPVSSGAVHRQHVFLLPWPRVRARRVGRPSRLAEWRQGLGQIIDAMDRSVEDLGREPPAWWRRGQPMQLTMATVAEHVVVEEDIVMAAVAETAGDEPAAAGDGAGDHKPAEPCTKRRKMHMAARGEGVVLLSLDHDGKPPTGRKEWHSPSFFAKTRTSTHPSSRVSCRRLPVPLLVAPRLPGTRSCLGPGRHRVPRLQQSVLWRRSLEQNFLNAHLETLGGIQLTASPIRQSTKIHSITWVLLQETQGRAREGVARSNDTDSPRTVPAEDRVGH